MTSEKVLVGDDFNVHVSSDMDVFDMGGSWRFWDWENK